MGFGNYRQDSVNDQTLRQSWEFSTLHENGSVGWELSRLATTPCANHMPATILTINNGSSSLKLGLYRANNADPAKG